MAVDPLVLQELSGEDRIRLAYAREVVIHDCPSEKFCLQPASVSPLLQQAIDQQFHCKETVAEAHPALSTAFGKQKVVHATYPSRRVTQTK